MNLGFLEFLGEPLMATVKELPDEYGELHSIAEELQLEADVLKDQGYEAADVNMLTKRLHAWLEPHYDTTTDDDGER